MNARATEELGPIVRAIAITSSTSFTFGGRAVDVPSPPGPSAGSAPGDPASALPAMLQQWLYRYCYSRRFLGAPLDDRVQAGPADDLVPALSRENSGRERWDQGWRIQQILPTGQIVAAKGALTRLFWPGEFLTHEGPGVAPRAGAPISAFWPRELRAIQSGFYFAFGEGLADQQNDATLVRFYWNVGAEGAPRLVRLLTRELNGVQVPFRFKCPSGRALFPRVDAGVLYVGKRFYKITAMLVDDVTGRMNRYLAAETPLFTKRLRPGLALAEDPRTGESFGMNRCRLVAEGLWTAHLEGQQSEEERLEAVMARFRRDGLDPDRAYLNSGAEDPYEELYSFAGESPGNRS